MLKHQGFSITQHGKREVCYQTKHKLRKCCQWGKTTRSKDSFHFQGRMRLAVAALTQAALAVDICSSQGSPLPYHEQCSGHSFLSFLLLPVVPRSSRYGCPTIEERWFHQAVSPVSVAGVWTEKQSQKDRRDPMANLDLRLQRAISVCGMSQHLSSQLYLPSNAPYRCFLSCVQGHEAGQRGHVLPVEFEHMHFHDMLTPLPCRKPTSANDPQLYV